MAELTRLGARSVRGFLGAGKTTLLQRLQTHPPNGAPIGVDENGREGAPTSDEEAAAMVAAPSLVAAAAARRRGIQNVWVDAIDPRFFSDDAMAPRPNATAPGSARLDPRPFRRCGALTAGGAGPCHGGMSSVR